MPTCIPENLKGSGRRPTPGENKVFSLLKKLPPDCIVWYELVLQEQNFRPDFMVLDPNRGVIVIEVKDWSASAIIEAGPEGFKVQMSERIATPVLNPDLKCKIYLSAAKERLMLIPELRDLQYRLLFPVQYVIAFPNITKDDFYARQLDAVINPDNVAFAEDLTSIQNLQDILQQVAPCMPNKITIEQRAAIRRELREETTVRVGKVDDNGFIKQSDNAGIVDRYSSDVFAIDVAQEQVAKGLGEGPRLLRGPAGTGKTIIMLIRARLLASNAEHEKKPIRILVLCWNISLANYMRQAFASINIPLKRDSLVEITHFADWARGAISRQLGPRRFPRSTDPDFAAKVSHLLQEINPPEVAKYHAMFIDELQDFDANWIQVLFAKFLRGENPKEKSFIAAGDYAQQIIASRTRIHFQGRRVTWASMGIPMVGRSKVLRKVYRNSARLWAYAGLFYGNIGEDNEDENGTANALIEFAPKPGHDPDIVECDRVEDQIKEAVHTIKAVSKEYSPRNILILYRRRTTKNGYHIVQQLMKKLEVAQIPYEWIAEDNESKSSFNWADDSVKLSTVHSAKGLDAPFVIVIGAEEFQDNDADADEHKLMYVALTRAREYLKILYTGENEMTNHIKQTLQLHQQYSDKIKALERRSMQNRSI